MPAPTILDYLDAPAEGLPFAIPVATLPERPTRLQVYAALMGINGKSPRVTKVVDKPESGGVYGRLGLMGREALALIELTGFYNGWLEATGGAWVAEINAKLDAEWERVKTFLDEADATEKADKQRRFQEFIDKQQGRAPAPASKPRRTPTKAKGPAKTKPRSVPARRKR